MPWNKSSSGVSSADVEVAGKAGTVLDAESGGVKVVVMAALSLGMEVKVVDVVVVVEVRSVGMTDDVVVVIVELVVTTLITVLRVVVTEGTVKDMVAEGRSEVGAELAAGGEPEST